MTEQPHVPQVRKGQGRGKLQRAEFARRFKESFYDPRFVAADLEPLIEIAWKNYTDSRKAPVTRKAGKDFADPDYDMSVEWLEAREQIAKAAKQHASSQSASRVLLICAAARNDDTCPGEMSKTYRLTRIAQQALQSRRCEVDLLDLSELTSGYKRVIHPCKACVSTAMPLCHWPCSCYPNHSLGQVHDWMNEIYPRWVAAHGVLIVTPVYWYQAPSVLKLMMDRMVCADGGNPDPSSTAGKDAAKAKEIEMQGWPYPRHLAGRAFGVVVHGDSEGADTLRRSLVDWLTDMKLVQAGSGSVLDRYIGYYEEYATSHEALDKDTDFQAEVRNVALSVANEIEMIRGGRREPDAKLDEPRPK